MSSEEKRKRKYLAFGHSIIEIRLILCINGGSDEDRLVFRITKAGMDCDLLMKGTVMRAGLKPLRRLPTNKLTTALKV